jgi:hypothetical protein
MRLLTFGHDPAGHSASAALDRRQKSLNLMAAYLHGLPAHSIMHAHAKRWLHIPRQAAVHIGSPANRMIVANAQIKSAALLQQGRGDEGAVLPWPPADSSSADSSFGPVTAVAQLRDLEVWYRTHVTVTPCTADTGIMAEQSRAEARQPSGHALAEPHSSDEMLLSVSMDTSVARRLLSDIELLDLSSVPELQVRSLADVQVRPHPVDAPRPCGQMPG